MVGNSCRASALRLRLEWAAGGGIAGLLLSSFLEASRGEHPPVVSGEDGVQALELAETGIRVNCVSPGSHSTDMMDGAIARATEKYNLPDGAFQQSLEGFIPMGRQGKVSELAAVVSFVCSDDASYVTGQTINVDGGARLD